MVSHRWPTWPGIELKSRHLRKISNNLFVQFCSCFRHSWKNHPLGPFFKWNMYVNKSKIEVHTKVTEANEESICSSDPKSNAIHHLCILSGSLPPSCGKLCWRTFHIHMSLFSSQIFRVLKDIFRLSPGCSHRTSFPLGAPETGRNLHILYMTIACLRKGTESWNEAHMVWIDYFLRIMDETATLIFKRHSHCLQRGGRGCEMKYVDFLSATILQMSHRGVVLVLQTKGHPRVTVPVD